MEFKWLEGAEAAPLLNPICQERGWALLNPETCTALCAFDGPKLVNFIVLQLYPLCGPALSTDPHAFVGMMDEIRNYLAATKARGLLVVAEHPIIAKLAEMEGLTKLEYPVYIR